MSSVHTDHEGVLHETAHRGVHGLNRRPTRADIQRPDPAALAAWTAANDRARRAYYAEPNAVTRAIYKGSW